MIAILEKTEHNTDFHQIVDFFEASHIRYALTISPTIYVSHIRQFWSTARIETTNQETKILTTVDGRPRTISESSLRRHLKLSDEEGISQFFHQWKFLIHTIMQCLSPKSTGFNEFSSNIATAVVCLATNRVYNFSKMIFDGMGKGSAISTEPHHTPSPQEYHSPQHDSPTTSHPTTTSEQIPQSPTESHTHRQYTRRATRIAQSKALSPATDEPASLSRDDRQGEAFPTVSRLDAGHDRENINKTSALPHESSPRVTSLDADKGHMQQRLQELMELCTSLQRQQSQMAAKINDQDLEISGLKEMVKFLEDKDIRSVEPTQEDAPIKWEIKETGEEVKADKSTELGSNDTDEMVNVLSSMEAANILTSEVAAASVSPVAGVSAADLTTFCFPLSFAPMVGLLICCAPPIVIPLGRLEYGVTTLAVVKITPTVGKLPLTVGTPAAETPAAETPATGETLAAATSLVVDPTFGNNNIVFDMEQGKEYMSNYYSPGPEEGERVKRQGLKIDKGSSKRMKTSEDVSEEDLKGMLQLVPLEEVYVEALQVKHPIIDWEIHSEGKREYWKIIRL
nr:ribonuclease H-like domain, reverse transcriptase, RNA-dependent DNA polymerase [Tanacetum cinerariifolium]